MSYLETNANWLTCCLYVSVFFSFIAINVRIYGTYDFVVAVVVERHENFSFRNRMKLNLMLFFFFRKSTSPPTDIHVSTWILVTIYRHVDDDTRLISHIVLIPFHFSPCLITEFCVCEYVRWHEKSLQMIMHNCVIGFRMSKNVFNGQKAP